MFHVKHTQDNVSRETSNDYILCLMRETSEHILITGSH